MSENVKNEENDSSDKATTDAVWPPEIEHHFADNTSRVFLTKTQIDRMRYFWIHVLMVPLTVVVTVQEYFSTSPGWWQIPLYKLLILCVCLLGFVGNLWRAYQGWQVKAILDLHGHG